MFTGHRLAVALGVVDAQAVNGDDELSRKQLVRAGEAMVNVGLAIVLNRPGTKQPLCTLTAIERKKADQAARDVAAAAGDPLFHRRSHACGIAHAITDAKTATRVLTRLIKRGTFNIGVEPRASRVMIVDLDTSAQLADFSLRCGQSRPTLTVRSPGQRNQKGQWVHSNGGHIWFDVPEEVELPTDSGSYTDDAGWSAVWGEHQVLVPPSFREEGPYVLVGSSHPLPVWLLDLVTTSSMARRERREESRRRRQTLGPSAIDDWSAGRSWDDILIPAGWTKTGLVKNCGCPQWTAPGDHASPESATAHEPGCVVYTCDRGHGPLHVWTDNPGDEVAQAIDRYGTRTLTMAQVITFTEGAGDMRRTLVEQGIPDLGSPTVLPKQSFTTWDEELAPVEITSSGHSQDTARLDTDEDDDGEDSEKGESIDHDERMIRYELKRELWRRTALERIASMNTPPLRWLDSGQFLDAPRPEPLVPRMLYRDSLSRMYGAPGSGKSYLALDIVLSLVLGRFWSGARLPSEPVVYAMAEGQAVNGDRTEAWLSKHGVERSALLGKLFVVPDAVPLTEHGVTQFVDRVHELQPALVVLDTKNAMMIGEENSATDFATMRRALDLIRKAAGCCVLLIDHSGYEGNRARGSSAGTAAMDTEIRVVMEDQERPALVTVEVTRDKASEAGTIWAFRMTPEHPAAVLVSADIPSAELRKGAPPVWMQSDEPMPAEIDRYHGQGQNAIVDLARMMQHDAGREHDPARIGISRAEAVQSLKTWVGADSSTVRRAWSALKDMGWIVPAGESANEVGKHVWVAKNRPFQDRTEDQP